MGALFVNPSKSWVKPCGDTEVICVRSLMATLLSRRLLVQCTVRPRCVDGAAWVSGLLTHRVRFLLCIGGTSTPWVMLPVVVVFLRPWKRQR